MQELYKGKKPRLGKPFVMLHCWVLHQHNQKWLTRKDEAPPKRQKSRNSSLQFEGFQDVVDDGILDEDRRGGSPTASSEAPTRTRPPGRKAEKEKLKRGAAGGTYKEVFQEMLTKREEMEEHKEARWIEVKAMEERKAAFKERKVAIEEEKLRIMGNKVVNKNLEREQKIMFMDTSCLDDQQKAYVKTMRARFLAAHMGGFEGGTSNGSNDL